jgi:hypothetical protein
VGDGGVDGDNAWKNDVFRGDKGERSDVGDAERDAVVRLELILGGSLAAVNVEYCEPFEIRRGLTAWTDGVAEAVFVLLAA